MPGKPDKFDPYREALVVESETVWPEELAVPAADRPPLEARLHADPQACGHLEYFRLPTGFLRRITVTAEDLARLRPSCAVAPPSAFPAEDEPTHAD